MSYSFTVPPGMRFLPTDAQLLRYYLYRKVTGQPLPYGVVFECDLYGQENPWEIWNRYAENVTEGADLYFFTRLKRKNSKAKRVERKAGLGSWEGETIGKEINAMVDGREQCVGFMKRFRFEKSQTHHDGAWIMHEYSLNHSLFPPDFQMNDYVLCRIRKNERITKKQNKRKRSELMDAKSSLELDQPKKRQKETTPDVQNGMKPEKENVKKQKDIELENIPSILHGSEAFSREAEDRFSFYESFQFEEQKQRGIESELMDTNSSPELDQPKKLQNGIIPEEESVKKQKDIELENLPPILCSFEEIFNVAEDRFSSYQPIQFEEQKQKGIESEKKEENSHLFLGEESALDGTISPFVSILEDQELYFGDVDMTIAGFGF